MSRIIRVGLLAAALTAVGAPVAVAGQPNVSCQSPGARTIPGQSTTGFANASLRYAGSELNPTVTKGVGNAHAVSQYDISCFGGRAR
jgi:hypothetical protein